MLFLRKFALMGVISVISGTSMAMEKENSNNFLPSRPAPQSFQYYIPSPESLELITKMQTLKNQLSTVNTFDGERKF